MSGNGWRIVVDQVGKSRAFLTLISDRREAKHKIESMAPLGYIVGMQPIGEDERAGLVAKNIETTEIAASHA